MFMWLFSVLGLLIDDTGAWIEFRYPASMKEVVPVSVEGGMTTPN
jgi:hypothetical protein